MRAFYRGYNSRSGRRAGQVRRCTSCASRPVSRPLRRVRPGGRKHRDSDPIVIDPAPATPPEGLTWCPPCVGRASERAGLLAQFAAHLARWAL